MSLRKIPNLVQGVSQQAASQRRDSQCGPQFDCINSPTDGAVARPHFDFVKLYAGADYSSGFFSEFRREDEAYVIGVNSDLPLAINLSDGTVATITQTAGTGYLAAGSRANADAVRVEPVEDTIFILNQDATPLMDASSVNTALPPWAYVVGLVPASNTKYAVTLTGPTANFSTDSLAVVYESASVDLEMDADIMGGLRTLIDGNNGYFASLNGTVLRVSRTAGSDFTVTTGDGHADTYMYAIKDTCPSSEKLPPRGFVGDVVKVAGESATVADDFYLTWVGGAATGLYEEVIGDAVPKALQAATMPHLLVNTGLNAFEYKQATWSSRIVGDLETSPDPSFIGGPIMDIFYHENRLGFLLPSGCFWSKNRFPFTPFPDTVQTILATAPVDLETIRSGSSLGTSSFAFAVGFDESLTLWSQRAQYRVVAGDDNVFKQGSVSAKASTAYEFTQGCSPVPVGRELLKANEVGPWASLSAIASSRGAVVGETSLTRHVPRYIPTGVKQLVYSEAAGGTFVRTSGAPSSLFLHNSLTEGNQYIQSSWNTWRIPGGTVLWIDMVGSKLYLLQQRAEGVALLSTDLTVGRVDDVAGAGYLTRLDLRVTQADVTSLAYADGSTTFVLPWKPTGTVQVITSEDKAGGYTRGRSFKVTDVTDYTVTVVGDLTGYNFYVGEVISASREESRFYDRGEDGPEPWDRLTVESFRLNVSATGYTRLEVVKPNKDGVASTAVWEARKLDSASFETETCDPQDDNMAVGVGELAENAIITMINDTYLPSAWQSAAYVFSGVRAGAARGR